MKLLFEFSRGGASAITRLTIKFGNYVVYDFT